MDSRFSEFLASRPDPAADLPAQQGPPPLSGVDRMFSDMLQDWQAPFQELDKVKSSSIIQNNVTYYVHEPLSVNETASISALLFLHGGCFVATSAKDWDSTCKKMCMLSNAVIVVPEYTRATEEVTTKFPRGLNDCFNAFEWLVANAKMYNVDPSKIAVGGDSAGASLALGVCIRARDEKLFIRPWKQVLLHPFIDPQCSSASWYNLGRGGYWIEAGFNKYLWEMYLGDQIHARNNACIYPLNSQLNDLPEARILLSSHDPCMDEGLQLACCLKLSNIKCVCSTYNFMPHEFWCMDKIFIEESSHAMKEISAFIRN